MSSPPRAAGRVPPACLAIALPLFAALAAQAQPAPAPDPAPPRVAHPAKPVPHESAPSSFAFVPWFTLEPVGSGLIRVPGGPAPLDLAARQQDDSDIIVYGRHKAVDPRSDREHDFSAPGWSEIAIPRDLPIGPPSSCSSGAYRTIGGQPANGQDLVGGLGGGRC